MSGQKYNQANNKSNTVVIASSNPGKLKEFAYLLADFGMEVKPQTELGVDDAEETGLTFVENSILKARHASQVTGFPAIADDSGIEVDALDGAPGIYSARFASMHGRDAGDARNNALLLEKLTGLEAEQRTARFRSVIVYMRHALDPSPLIASGVWEGRILEQPEGEHGFGYDPLFYAPETRCSAALLDKARKNELSHRGKALTSLVQQLDSV